MKKITLYSCAHVNLVVKSKIAIKILRATPFNAEKHVHDVFLQAPGHLRMSIAGLLRIVPVTILPALICNAPEA